MPTSYRGGIRGSTSISRRVWGRPAGRGARSSARVDPAGSEPGAVRPRASADHAAGDGAQAEVEAGSRVAPGSQPVLLLLSIERPEPDTQDLRRLLFVMARGAQSR